ncbi:MAG TPA: response regulator [Cyclobacteriaceae bacterium]|nr:response regulator [Cyclobacteriaceae bacterium]
MNSYKKLTLVDDDEIFVFLTKKMIEQVKVIHLLNVFGNGLDALNFLRDKKNDADLLPEIILLDLSMPVLNGWQFLEEYTKLYPIFGKKIIVYVCSSSISSTDINRAKSINEVSDYVIKPITIDKLRELVKF